MEKKLTTYNENTQNIYKIESELKKFIKTEKLD